MCGPTPYGHHRRMSSSLHHLAAEQHLDELRRAADGERRLGRLARRADRARRSRARGVRRGLRILRPAV